MKSNLSRVVLGFSLVLLLACAEQKPTERDVLAYVNNHAIATGVDKKLRKSVEELIDRELVFQKAVREGFLNTNDMARQMVADQYLRHVVRRQVSEPTEKQVRDYFEKHRQSMERVRVSHILIKPKESQQPEKGKAAARSIAEGLVKELRAIDDVDFAKYAEKYSDDHSNKKRGGDLGFFVYRKMPEALSKAAFALNKVGDISDVVETDQGFHILQLTGEVRGLDRFRAIAATKVRTQVYEANKAELYAKLRKTAKIKVQVGAQGKTERGSAK